VSYNDVEYIGRLPRALAIAIGLRIVAPRPDNIPRASISVPRIDTGASFRPDWRMQDPSRDPKEPNGNESGGTGNDHGWSNCTMVSAALAYAYHVQDKSGPQGGDMRHNQDDLSGGTDLYDAKTAWDRYGNQELKVKSGAGWGAVKTAHNEGRAIIIQGTGNVPGNETFDGYHACVIGPETNSEGKWLFGDPLATGWQWVPPSKIETWAKALDSSIYFAVSKVQPSAPPEPKPPQPPDEEEVPWVDIDAIVNSAVKVREQELLNENYFWSKHPDEQPAFPVDPILQMVPNAGWGVGRWNQTTWYLAPDASKWGEAVWAGTGTIEGGRWA
jgi:hypothetical protein